MASFVLKIRGVFFNLLIDHKMYPCELKSAGLQEDDTLVPHKGAVCFTVSLHKGTLTYITILDNEKKRREHKNNKNEYFCPIKKHAISEVWTLFN